MKRYIILLSSLVFLCVNAIDVSAKNIEKKILLRSKEKVNFSKSIIVDLPLDSLPEEYRGLIRNEDFTEDSEPISISSFRDVEMLDYEEYLVTFSLSYSVEAYKYKDIVDLQEDIAKAISTTNKYASQEEKLVLSYLENEKSIDGIFNKLGSLDNYDAICVDDSVVFKKETVKFPNSKRNIINRRFALSVKNGVLYLNDDYRTDSNKLIGIYDIEKNKRILLCDLLTSVKIKNKAGTSVGFKDVDSLVMTKVASIEKDNISFNYEGGDFYVKTITKEDSLLTPYAEYLMSKDKGYIIETIEKGNGDLVQIFDIYRIDDSYDSKKIALPYKLNGTSNTEKIRNKMLEVMFGESSGNIENLVLEGVKSWGRRTEMLFRSGDGIVTFGFENNSIHNNSNNTFIVFDKKTGEEIKAIDLIKDKKGFMKFVNSHKYYMAGFLFSDTNEGKEKYGSEFRSYLKHSVNFGDFKGLDEFPTSWFFVFNKMDEVIPVEFNTKSCRIFLDYSDIRKFINKKYLKIMDNAVMSIKK